MGTYVCGPSVLRLTGRVGAVIPGDTFEHDFSVAGPEGLDGPSREASMIAAGAMTRLDTPTEAERLAAAAAADAAARALETTTAAAPEASEVPVATTADAPAGATASTPSAPSDTAATAVAGDDVQQQTEPESQASATRRPKAKRE